MTNGAGCESIRYHLIRTIRLLHLSFMYRSLVIALLVSIILPAVNPTPAYRATTNVDTVPITKGGAAALPSCSYLTPSTPAYRRSAGKHLILLRMESDSNHSDPFAQRSRMG